eukprot:TRINITY_DN3134_c0_g1_i3.p1 TRINITY_DN3134_c0_g1~~TRINITY_DN3134_c0_g1_i3.p1  ORF type:complete len:290 (+),score=65.28 TRINITY_DN3134_c0_g1_i3:319-1188(+)
MANLGIALKSQSKHSEEAHRWLGQAAAAGEAHAQATLGLCYRDENDLGCAHDNAKAIELLESAARGGHASSMFNLAMLLKERGSDPGVSIEWVAAAGRAGLKEALYMLAMDCKDRKLPASVVVGGSSCCDLDSSSCDPGGRNGTVFAWTLQAARQGLPQAQLYAAGMLMHGWTGTAAQNPTAALQLTKAAAEQGHLEAQCNLVAFYESGWGTPVDRDQALYWAQKAAQHGQCTGTAVRDASTSEVVDYLESGLLKMSNALRSEPAHHNAVGITRAAVLIEPANITCWKR